MISIIVIIIVVFAIKIIIRIIAITIVVVGLPNSFELLGFYSISSEKLRDVVLRLVFRLGFLCEGV